MMQRRTIYLGGFALFAVLIALAGTVRAAGELPKVLKEDLAKIREQLQSIDQRIGKRDKASLEQSLLETKQWIDEFAIDGEFLDGDPLVEGLRQQHKALAAKLAAAPEPMKAKPAMKTATTIPAREDLAKMVKTPVDLANVSFKKDVAPIIANVCLGCHNDQRKSGEFDASTYNAFLTMIQPGNPDDSHVMQLVTGKAEPRMPRGGQSRFLKEWADVWSAWIKQGAKFDGTDKGAKITSYLIDLESQRREAFNKMATAELETMHEGYAKRQIEIVKPRKDVHFRKSRNLILYTTLPSEDVEYVSVLAEAVLEELAEQFKVEPPIWRGGLGLMVFADRFDFVAFAKEIDGYAPENDEVGYYQARPEHQYIALTTDAPNRTLDGVVAQEVAEAFLRRLGAGKMPAWAVHGYGQRMAEHFDPRGTTLKPELAKAGQLADSGKKLSALFKQDLPWVELAPMGTSFVGYIHQSDKNRTVAYLKALAETGDWNQAAEKVLRSSEETLGRGWEAWAKNAKPAGRKRTPKGG
jgi:hypothetical protein